MNEDSNLLYAQAPTDKGAWIKSLRLTLMINGGEQATGNRGSLIDPCTGEFLAEFPQASLDDLETAIRAAKQAFGQWSNTQMDARRDALKLMAQEIQTHAFQLSWILAFETGRPLRKALSEIQYTLHYISIFTNVDLPDQDFSQQGYNAVLTHRPLGVVGAIAPWNAPIILAVAKIANALLAGNTVVLRPSPFTPLSTLLLGRILRDTLPPGVLNTITGDNEVGKAIVTHQDIAKINFTGSTEVGRKIACAAAPYLKSITLELGGNDAAIALEDADPQAFVDTIYNISLANCGQYCAAAKRLYVHRSIYCDVRDALRAKANDAILGDNLDPATTMGPVQNSAQFERMFALIDDAIESGGTIAAGGNRLDRRGFFVPPTIIEGVNQGVRLVDEEQFGPVIPLIPFDNEESALEMANCSQFGLGGSVWSDDLNRAISLASRLQTGTAWVNQHGAFSAAIPMPSAKQSGIGTDYAHFGVAAHSRHMLLNTKHS